MNSVDHVSSQSPGQHPTHGIRSADSANPVDDYTGRPSAGPRDRGGDDRGTMTPALPGHQDGPHQRMTRTQRSTEPEKPWDKEKPGFEARVSTRSQPPANTLFNALSRQ